ncbi:hypothetical protein KEM52_004298, partial [Ascosphaera acerosa]
DGPGSLHLLPPQLPPLHLLLPVLQRAARARPALRHPLHLPRRPVAHHLQQGRDRPAPLQPARRRVHPRRRRARPPQRRPARAAAHRLHLAEIQPAHRPRGHPAQARGPPRLRAAGGAARRDDRDCPHAARPGARVHARRDRCPARHGRARPGSALPLRLPRRGRALHAPPARPALLPGGPPRARLQGVPRPRLLRGERRQRPPRRRRRRAPRRPPRPVPGLLPRPLQLLLRRGQHHLRRCAARGRPRLARHRRRLGRRHRPHGPRRQDRCRPGRPPRGAAASL